MLGTWLIHFLVHYYIGLLNNINLLFLGTYGACCHFPFKYEYKKNKELISKKYYECDNMDKPQPWCATTVNEDEDDEMESWEFCADAFCMKGKSVL